MDCDLWQKYESHHEVLECEMDESDNLSLFIIRVIMVLAMPIKSLSIPLRRIS